MHEKIIILDFGSQTTQLIARRVRELNTYCEIVPYNKFPQDTSNVKGVILSGSPFSVYDDKAFKTDLSFIRANYPVLGICYGAQFISHISGGKVEPAGSREYGRAHLTHINNQDALLKHIEKDAQVWMSHGDTITKIPANFEILASTPQVKIAAYRVNGEKTWGVQFHPEVFHTECGLQLLDNFLNICGCKKDWTPASFIEETVSKLQEQLGNDKVILALSGGVDSSVVAVLLNKAIGKNLTCVFVDNGLLRKNEFEKVLEDYAHLGLNVLGIDAKAKFYNDLAGVSDPETKRKIIGSGFIDIFNQEARKLENFKWLAQGTIYPDIIESLSITGHVIKSHHNVGGLPKEMNLKLVEPLRLLFKE
jgi:GMP synthase (glutamine-hydrolysing)